MTAPVDAATMAEVLAHLTVVDAGGTWVGQAPDWFGDTLFGGFVVGQTAHAATRVAPAGTRLHSLHGYFLRPARAGVPIHHEITPVRDGRTFSTRKVEASQDGKPVFHMTCSYTSDADGYEYGPPPAADLPSPEQLPTFVALGGWEVADVGPTPPDATGFRSSTWRGWLRAAGPMPEDECLHTAMLAFLTDITRTGGRPLHLDGDTRGLVSIDHAVWFHRPARVDQWLLHDVQALVNTRGRGLLRGAVYDAAGVVVVSSAQEMLIRRYDAVGG